MKEEEGCFECTGCAGTYHFGKCAGITEKSYKAKKAAARKTWRCPACSRRPSRAGCGEEGQDDPGIAHVLASINEKLECLPFLSAKVESMELSVQVMSEQYDEVLKKMREQENEIKILKKRVNELENDRGGDETAQLKRELNRLEQYGRANNLEVHGLVETLNEDLLDKLNTIADRIDVPRLTTESVEAVHRVQTKSKKTPMVIVRFVNRSERNRWLQNKLKLRRGAAADNIYLQENLTASNRKLFYDVRTKARNLDYRFVWHREGYSYVRKREGDPVIRVEHDQDLSKLT